VVWHVLPVPSSATPGSARVPEETFVAVSPPRFRHARSRAAVPPTSRSALPEVSLVLADLQPTPTVVSSAFNVITFLPQYLWLLMVLAPNWSVTRKIMEPLWPVLLFAAVHIFIVLNVASVNSDNLSDFTELAKVFDPRVSTNLFGDFSPQAAMMNLMQSPGFVSEEWAHVLAWDLFVGRWIYLDGLRRGIFTSHSVLFCNLIGPPGLLMHAITCFVVGKGLPKEEGLEDPK
ncbi:MHZ4, partial [Symbiodinium sp. KB8]